MWKNLSVSKYFHAHKIKFLGEYHDRNISHQNNLLSLNSWELMLFVCLFVCLFLWEAVNYWSMENILYPGLWLCFANLSLVRPSSWPDSALARFFDLKSEHLNIGELFNIILSSCCCCSLMKSDFLKTQQRQSFGSDIGKKAWWVW